MNEQDNKVAGANPSKEATELVTSFKATFKSCMADDLHTPVVVSSFSDPLKFMNNLLHTRKVQSFLFFRH
jgi:cysteinyl-tRNA synthetase